MPITLSCSQGHSWEIADAPAALATPSRCPVCAQPATTDVGTGTLSFTPADKPVANDATQQTEVSAPAFATLPHVPSGPARSSTTKMPELPGYEIIEELGRGAMGVVYKARQLGANRLVALKMILSGEHAGASELARFRTEAEAAARLSHPGIVQLYEVGEHDGRPFFSLEYCEGGTLARKLAGTPQPPREAAAITEQLSHAMAAAHAAGVVHRDLKPANVLLLSNAEFGTRNAESKEKHSGFDSTFRIPHSALAKIADFGMAKHLDTDSGHTRTHAVMGTPSYMAPEQAMGMSRDVGPSADVYALGAILYEMLTGRPPFKGATTLETLDQVRTKDPVSPRLLQPAVPRDLETICLKCLRKEPEKRYASAGDLANDLKHFLANEPIQARPVGRVERAIKWVRRNPVETAMTCGMLLLLAGGVLGIWLKYRDAEEQKGIAQDRATKLGIAIGERDKFVDDLKAAVKDRDRAAGERETALGKARDEEKRAKEQEELAKQRAKQLSYTLNQRDDALKKARAEEERALHLLDNSYFQLAKVAAQDGLTDLAMEQLYRIRPLQRGWEWNYLRQQPEGGIFTLYGHHDEVTAVVFSPDGTRLATGSKDGTARVWDARTGKLFKELEYGFGAVQCLCFSPDGTRLAVGFANGPAQVWDAKTGKVPVKLAGHKLGITGVCFSPDGTRLATCASKSTSVHICDAQTGEPVQELKWSKGEVSSVCFSPDGARLATCSPDSGPTGVWDARSGTLLLKLRSDDSNMPPVLVPLNLRAENVEQRRRSNLVTSVCFSPDGTQLVTNRWGFGAQLWQVQSGAQVLQLTPHSGWATNAAFSPDGTHLAISFRDGTARVCDARTGKSLLDVKGHAGPVRGSCFSPDGARLATCSADKTARVWDVRVGTPTIVLKSDSITSVNFSPDGERLATGSFEPDEARIWDRRTGTPLLTLKGNTALHSELPLPIVWEIFPARIARYSPDGTRLATNCNETVRVWNSSTGTSEMVLKGHTGPVTSVCFSQDGSRLATGSEDKTVCVWDARTGKQLLEMKGGTLGVMSLCFSPNGKWLAGAPWYGSARVWDARTGAPLLQLTGHAGDITSVCFSPDSKRLATTSLDRTARVWDAGNGTMLLELKGHADRTTDVSFSPDGERLATASDDKSVRIWDARTGAPLLELKVREQIKSVCFSPDGSSLATEGSDGSVRLWDTRPGLPIELIGHTDDVVTYSFDPFGKSIATAAKDYTVRIWDVDTGWPQKVLRALDPPLRVPVHLLAYNSDGRLLATAAGKEVRVWDTFTGRPFVGHGLGIDQFTGLRNDATELSFSPDERHLGARDVFGQVVVWDLQSGKQVKDSFPNLRRNFLTFDSKWLAIPHGNRLRLVPRKMDSEEWFHRLWFTRPEPEHHAAEFAKFEKDGNRFAAAFHLDRMLAYQPHRRGELLQKREKSFGDHVTYTRATLHTPSAVPDRNAHAGTILFLAHQRQPLALRLLGGLLTRSGKPAEAIAPLQNALSLREGEKPPVEELLLALALADMNQIDEARRWLERAADWMDRYKTPFQIASALGCAPSGSLFVATEMMKQPLDPRYNVFDWETWHEAEVFRREVEAKLKSAAGIR